MAEKLLDLSTIDPDRPTIAVDGVSYEMWLRDDFGLVELARLQRLQGAVSDIMSRVDDLSDEDVGVVTLAVDGFCALVLPAMPAHVRAKLRDNQKLAIIGAFRMATESKGKPLPPPASPPTGES